MGFLEDFVGGGEGMIRMGLIMIDNEIYWVYRVFKLCFLIEVIWDDEYIL